LKSIVLFYHAGSLQNAISKLLIPKALSDLSFVLIMPLKIVLKKMSLPGIKKHPEDAFKGKSHLDISRQSVESTRQVGY